MIVGAPLVGIVYRVMSSGARKRSLAVQEELGSTYTIATENYGAQAVVKAFGLEEKERDRFARGSERLFGREVKLQLFGGLFGLSVNMIVAVLQITVLGLGSWLILHGRLAARRPRRVQLGDGPSDQPGDRTHRARAADPVVDGILAADQRSDRRDAGDRRCAGGDRAPAR